MKTSEEINELVIAMNKFQKEVEPPKKNNENPAFKREGKKLKYADLDAIIKAITPKLTENGLSQMQFTSSDLENKSVSVTTLITHSSGQFIMSEPLILPAENYGKFNAQTIGSSITYGRRYSLSAMLGIASEDDDDANIQSLQDDENKQGVDKKQSNNRNKNENQPMPPNVNELNDSITFTMEEIKKIGGNMGIVRQQFMQAMGLENMDNYNKTDLLKFLQGTLNDMKQHQNEQGSLLEGRTTKPATSGTNWGAY